MIELAPLLLITITTTIKRIVGKLLYSESFHISPLEMTLFSSNYAEKSVEMPGSVIFEVVFRSQQALSMHVSFSVLCEKHLGWLVRKLLKRMIKNV